ncbi:hypothetical protein T265_08573 [Opisthorchis viverrini]|uniref:Uncharacterized protein n=1 Tax=Opisthorchis viverrini TaxID=6198 RepID=A0A074ZJP2_OPIVI|nr:hypothetical protein T265_08573 [Opisthorchis viverrini]KER23580.1 hypothetical protein T265_08573 [Opisthorchis viverrini]
MPNSEWRKQRGGQPLTWQRSMKEITKRLGAVGTTHLPGWGPRGPHCVWLEILQDMAANRQTVRDQHTTEGVDLRCLCGEHRLRIDHPNVIPRSSDDLLEHSNRLQGSQCQCFLPDEWARIALDRKYPSPHQKYHLLACAWHLQSANSCFRTCHLRTHPLKFKENHFTYLGSCISSIKMIAGLKSVGYETRLAVLDPFPLEYRPPRGDLILTYAPFEQSLANRFFTIDPTNTRRRHGRKWFGHVHACRYIIHRVLKENTDGLFLRRRLMYLNATLLFFRARSMMVACFVYSADGFLIYEMPAHLLYLL